MNNNTFLALPNITSPHVAEKARKTGLQYIRAWHAGGQSMGAGEMEYDGGGILVGVGEGGETRW